MSGDEELEQRETRGRRGSEEEAERRRREEGGEKGDTRAC